MPPKPTVFLNLPSATVTSWNPRQRELAKQGHYREALELYRRMLRSGGSPDTSSFPFALKSCAALSLPLSGAQLHSHALRTGCVLDPYVHSSLISFYCKCSLIENARQLFDENPHSRKITVSYNALIAGYALNCRPNEAFLLFRLMRRMGVPCDAVTMLGLIPACAVSVQLGFGACVHACDVKLGLDKDVAVANSLLTMYVKCVSLDLARKLFDEMPVKELITWNAMISGYAQSGLAADALGLYQEMKSRGISPDPVTLIGVLSSCAHLGAQSVGQEVEQQMGLSSFGSNTFLTNALINMYARCGNLVKARKIFDEMPGKNLISWTAIIGGYGVHGHGEIAVQLFDQMISIGIRPDETVFVCVLSACSHAGLTERGLNYFAAMQRVYMLRPGPQHYSCMVDLLGRAGRLKEARDLIDSMSMKPDGAVWGALLGACRIHRNVELAELAFQQIIELEPMNVGYYVLLANIYSEAKDLRGVLRVRVMMRERKFRKEPGCSYVDHKGSIHLFLVGDRTHPQVEEIYQTLAHLDDLVEKLGGSKSNSQESASELMAGMGVHSEKLAVAFGLLNTEADSEIVVIKNLRVCGDCHAFMKCVSEIANRRLVIRDSTRFHHFQNGACSCNDYW